MIRAGLVFLAVAQGLAGLVQLFAPRFFYEDIPTSATPWVSLLPPYNEHLMRDVGALTLAYVLVLAAAAIWMEPRLVQVALAANLVFTVTHFVFHATHLDHYPLGSAIGQTVALGVGVLLPATLLVLSVAAGPPPYAGNRGRRPTPVDNRPPTTRNCRCRAVASNPGAGGQARE